MKLCKDCKHCYQHALGPYCSRQNHGKISPVDGAEIQPKWDELPTCISQRSKFPKILIYLFGLCGPEARFFDLKQDA